MAKKKKVQDTSPLAMGRQQKGSAAYKKEQKAGTNTKSQSSVSKNIQAAQERGRSQTASTNTSSQSSYTPTRTTRVGGNNASSARHRSDQYSSGSSRDRINQKSYGATRRGTTPTAAYRQRNTPATSAEMRRQNAAANNNLKQTQAERSRNEQKQRFNTAKEMMSARRQTNEQVKAQNAKEWEGVKNTSKEEQQAWFTKKAQEAQQRHTGKVEKGTDNLATSAALSAFHGAKGAVHSLYGALTRASIQDEYDTQRDKALAALRGESNLDQVEKEARKKAQDRKELKLKGIRAKTLLEQQKVEELKEKEGAKDKGPIPLRKMAVGAASFTGQRVVDTTLLGPYSLASMGARVLEDERNAGQEKNERLKKRLAESGQFTQEELDEEFKRIDRRSVANAYASSGIEVLSELMFGGIGLSKKYMPEGTRGILDKTVGKLFGNIGKTAAGRLGLGIAEETAEEWIANPVQARVSNMLTGNRLQSLQEESVRREYQKQAMDLKEMQATSADINSDAFLERAKEIYKESGATDKEASKIAELARDYFNADIIGDSDTAEAKLSEITNILAGGENDLREKWTLKDALEVAGEMILSVGAEGFAGAISSSAAGNEYKANYGIEGVKRLAKVVENLDADKSDRAKAIIDDIDNGKDITGTQVSQIMEWSNETALKAQDREITRDNLVQNRMKDEKLFVPIVDSEYNLSPATDARFEEISDRVVDNIDNMGIKMSDVDAYAIADVVAAYETGTISAEQMNELNVENPEARAVFERETGINLDQYTVKDKRGNIKVAESNIKMQKALFSNAADNYMASARIEQENWNNVERGRAAESLTSDMDGMGGVGIQRVLESVDPRNRGDFMLAGSVARRVYDHARLTNDSWEDVRKDFKNAFPGATMDESMRYVYDMAKRTKTIAETQYYGKQVSNKQSLADSETMYVPGNFTNNSGRMLGNTELSTLTNMATTLGVNIVMSDNMANKNANGSYDSSTRTITLNAEKSMGEMLQFVLAHEVTHHLAAYAPDEYLKLSRFVMDKAYKADADKFETAIKNIQKKYKEQAKQDLTPEQALEEIIADNAHEFWQDEAFINDVTSEEPTLAQSIINAIKDILNKLRSILASGNITDENDRQFLFDEIDSYDQTYKLWMNAFRVARDIQANQAINDWQDEVNSDLSLADYEANERFSIVEDKNLIKQLEADEHRTSYRAMVQIDGKLYPPMSTQVRDEEGNWGLQQGIEIGQWVESDATTDSKMFNAKGQYMLRKDNGKTVPAAYNPYIHSSDTMLNDQFASAYQRPNMVVVEGVVPESELTNGVPVETELDDGRIIRAKDAPGVVDWKAGVVQGRLTGTRTVYLTNHFKPTRVVPDSEVAENIRDMVADTDVAIPYNVVTPSVREELLNLGVNMEQSNNAKYQVNLGESFSLSESEPTKKSNSAAAKYERGEKLTHKQFNSYYSAHKLNLRGQDNIEEQINDIKTNGFVSTTALSNVVPAGINDFVDPERPNYTEGRYGAREGDVVLLVPKNYLDKKNDRIENGFVPRDYEVVTVERDFQPYYELYEKAYDETNTGERFSISEQQDADYMKAVESGDMETAQRMVDELAKESGGYTENGNIVHLFHGTNAFGFTEFDLSKMDDGISIFLTSDKKMATTYSGADNQRSISEKSDVKLDTYEEIAEALNKYDPNKDYSESEYKFYDSEAIDQFVQDTKNELSVFIEEMNELLNNHSDIMSKEDIERFETMREQAKNDDPLLITNLWFSSPEYAGKHSEDYQRYYDAINMITDPLELEKHLRLREKLTEDWHPEGLFIESQLNGYSYEVISPETAKRMAEQFTGSGIYDLYTTFSNPLVIDNKENDNWNSIRVPIELQQDMWDFFGHQFSATRTRNYAQYAKAKGYDGVIFKGIRDNGGKNYGINEVSGDVFIVFNPNEVKSADPVTYDDNGNVIPLSKRFDMQNPDIRYSLDSEGTELSQGQETFFERSKNRNAEGQLKVMLHGTDADFTEFDPSKARPGTLGRAFYFSDSDAHAGQYGNVGRYYLNLEHPLMGDTHDITKDQLRKFVAYLADNEDYGIENYGADATVDSVTDSVWGGTDFVMLRDLNLSAVGDFAEAVKVFNKVNGTDYDGIITDVETAAFYPEQIKRTDNLNPTLSKDTRYSITDAEGRDLSNGQVSYFRNSMARDEQGRLVRCYRRTRIPGTELYDKRMWFYSDRKEVAQSYVDSAKGETILEYEDYLNITNPLILDCNGAFYYDLPFSEAVNAQGETVNIGDTFEESTIWNAPNTNIFARIGESRGYDGIIFRNIRDSGVFAEGEQPTSTIYVTFDSSQMRGVDNLNPSENPEIRYSIVDEDEAKSKIAYDDAIDNSFEALEYYEQRLADLTDEAAENRPIKRFNEDRIAEFYAGLKADDSVPYSDYVLEEDRVRMAQSKNDYFNNINAKWNDRWTTDGEVLNVKSVKTDVRNLIMGVMQNSDTDSQYKRELVNKTLFDIRTAYQLLKQDRPEVASELLYHSAQRMIDNVEFYIDDSFDQYKELKDYLRRTRISLGEEYWSDVDYDAFRKNIFGRLKLVKGKTNVDQIYQELEEKFPEWFNEEETMSVPDQLLQIEHVLDSVQPYKEAYSSEAAAELAFDIADDLYEIMVNGDEVRSLADTYKQRYDAKTKAMKQRHAEAMLRVRKARDEGIQAERAKFREYKEKQKERTAHRKEFDSIQNSYKTLTDRLLSNTADSNIPEQYKKDLAKLLAAFDLQTVGSKRREARTGWKAQKTIKLEAMRTALKSIENRTDDFYVNDSITDIIDSLLGLDSSNPSASIEGKTLDALNASELKKIDNLLKALVHEFNTYKNVRINARNQQAQDIADAQAASALEHAEKFGPGNDWEGPIGWLDGIINMDEMTPAYLFRQIDRKNEGLGLMWKELERAQDKYIRNTEQLTQWMQDITGKYHNTGRGSNKYGAKQIEEWRRSRSQVEFNLTHGSIKLTPAQMMSVACLANRSQAYQHMVGAGVVVAPVGFQAKTETDLKRKSNRGLSLILTDADIKLIVEQLTPEQKKMAKDLQQLMANQMAEWGNEASMDVIGIRLFEEKDYFPIKSDKAALVRDWTGEDVEQAIRNFGFTKAVQPNAKNSIMIEDIFDVVTEHCNNMNLYNSYSKALNDFMKVYNKHVYKELAEGRFSDQSLGQILAHAYSSKATNYIMSFIKDLNGNVSRGRVTGIEKMLQGQLANAKKASVFANIRVLLQQPTAITRAFAVISPKYLKGIKIERGAMKEMFEHCPIAKWKSWGYYDINMGKQIEDIIMNEGNFLEYLATQAYGAADNVTWTAIWQMVKAEMKDTHPDIVEGSDEFWYQCNERMREIVDLTQVVDSPMHRSHAMRDKSFIVKMATSFMAEPTLTFNMVRDGYIRAREAWAKGNKKEAASIMNKTMSVYVLQAAAVAAAAAIADALRGKSPVRGKSPDGGDDDKDKTFFASWWANAIANFQDELKLWNKIYWAKDISSLFEGYEAWNLGTQGITNFVNGYNQMTKKLAVGSKTPWWNIYQNLFGGLGYMTGIPVKTIMKDGRAIFEALGGQLPESLVGDNKKSEPVVDKDSAFGRIISGDNSITVKEGSALDALFGKFGLEVSSTKKAASSDSKKSEDGKEESKDPTQRTRKEERDKLRELEKKAKEKAEGLSGSELDEALWDVLSDGYTKELDAGNLDYIEHLELIYMNAGGDTKLFRAKIKEKIASSYKKSFKDEMSQEELYDQDRMRHYMEELLDYSEEEVSEICYKSNKARDLKVAFRLNNEEFINAEATILVRAGLSNADFEKLYKNRNRMNIKTYSGKYKDKLKSTGKYIWPCQGTITSGYGARSAPTAGASSWHAAIDIGAAAGTPVGAADGGTVIFAGWNGAGGKTVKVKHDDGTITYYQHLSWWDVHEGDVVGQGQQVGKVGSTGVSTGPHLDFRVETSEGKLVNPMDYLS